MKPLSVIITSRNASNLVHSAASVWKHENDWITIFIVDDGFQPNVKEREIFKKWSLTKSPVWIPGEKPFVFARNVNIAIRQTVADVVILNDDAILQTPGGLTLLQKTAEEHPELGVIAAVTNSVGNFNQLPKRRGLREDPRMVCFICALIPRRTIDTVGLLDERYVHYGCEDDDYCLRVRNAGLKIGIHDGCYVDHKTLSSTFRRQGRGDYSANLEIFKQKWGRDNFGRDLREA